MKIRRKTLECMSCTTMLLCHIYFYLRNALVAQFDKEIEEHSVLFSGSRDIFGGPILPKGTAPQGAVYLEDLQQTKIPTRYVLILIQIYILIIFETSDPSPKVDQVLDTALQDKYLARSYRGLANRS
jgi:hypothetical protein